MMAITLGVTAIFVAAAAVRPRPRRHQSDTVPAPARIDTLVISWTQRRARRREPSAREVGEWCDDIARRVRSGSSLRNAVTDALTGAAVERATAPLLLGLDRGQSIVDAIGRVRAQGPHLELALGVLATASRIGGPSAAAIDRTAMLLRQRTADLEERSTQAAQALLATHVMTAVPLVMLGVLVVTDTDVRSVATSSAGASCIGAGLLLNVAGWCWMHRIVRSST